MQWPAFALPADESRPSSLHNASEGLVDGLSSCPEDLDVRDGARLPAGGRGGQHGEEGRAAGGGAGQDEGHGHGLPGQG
jgi:hypothetical protein